MWDCGMLGGAGVKKNPTFLCIGSTRNPTIRLKENPTKNTIEHSLHVVWSNFFSSCAVVSFFWYLAENRFWCYLLTYLEYNTVVAL